MIHVPLNRILILTIAVSLFVAACENTSDDTVEKQRFSALSAGMTVAEKVGQIFCLTVDPIHYFVEPTYKQNINRLIRIYRPGGIYLTTRLEDWRQETLGEFNATKLLAEVNEIIGQSSTPPLFIADFESGAWTWDSNAAHFSYPVALGAMGSPDMAIRQGKITATEARNQGITMILSPSLNTPGYFGDSAPLYSMSDDPAVIAELGKSYIDGCQESNVASCARYFPWELFLDNGNDALAGVIEPFRSAISGGAYALMVSPVTLGDDVDWDARNGVIPRIIRDDLGFKGTIVVHFNGSDDYEQLTESDIPTIMNAVNAGCNMLIIPETNDEHIPLIDDLIIEIEESRLEATAIEKSLEYILALKDTIQLPFGEFTMPMRGIAGVGLSEYLKTARRLSDESITLVKNDGGMLPVNPDDMYIVPITVADENSSFLAAIYERKLKELFPNTPVITVIGDPNTRERQEVLRRTAEADRVIFSMFFNPETTSESISPAMKSLLNDLYRLKANIITISFFDPTVIADYPGTDAFIATYSPAENTMDSVLEIVSGARNPVGKLPIGISTKYPAGHGLTY